MPPATLTAPLIAAERVWPKRLSEAAFERRAMRRDHPRAEWVNGEVRLMSPVNWDHTDYVIWLGSILRIYAETKDLGKVVGPEYMVRLLPDRPRRRVPDLLFVTKTRLNLVRRNYLDGPPDLAVEVVSPDDPARDYREKYLEYEEAGVGEYWIVDPVARRVEFHVRARTGRFKPVPLTDERLKSKVLRGLAFDPQWALATPLPKTLDVLRSLGVV